MRVVELESTLAAPADVVWEHVSTFTGVNDELRPLMRMTAPRHLRRLDPSEVVLGERICRSWVLLFGVLPIDSASRRGCRARAPARADREGYLPAPPPETATALRLGARRPRLERLRPSRALQPVA